jgi:O-antigen/teichoic acid export membrane protein
LVYFVFLVGLLSQEEMGVYTLLTFTLNLVALFGNFALPAAATKYISQFLAEGNLEKAKSVVNRLLRVWLLSSAICFVSLFLPAELLSKLMFDSPNYTIHFMLLSLCVVFMILNVFMQNSLRGLQKIGDFALTGFLYAVFHSVLGLVLLFAGLGLLAVVLSWLVGLVVSSLTGLFLTMKNLGLTRKPHPLRPLINFSYPLYVSNIISFLATWVDSILIFSYVSVVIGPIRAQELLGIYYVAVRASLIPMLFSTAIITALLPQLSELYTREGLSSLKDAFRVSTRYLALIGFPMIIGLATLSSPIIVIFAGQEYAAAALPLTIICFSVIPTTLGVAINPILLTLERTKIVSLITVLSIFFNIVASFVTLAYLNLGLPGPAVARTFSTIITLALSAMALKGIFSLKFDSEALRKAAFSSLLMIMAIFLLEVVRRIVMPSPNQFLVITLPILILYIVVGAATYFLSLVALKTIKKYDIEMLHDYLPKGFKWVAAWLSRLAHLE